jgi:hypothetical protein
MSRASGVDLSKAERSDLEALAESDLPCSDLARALLEATDE